MTTYKFKCPDCGCEKLCETHTESDSTEIIKISRCPAVGLSCDMGDACDCEYAPDESYIYRCTECSRCWYTLMDVQRDGGLVEEDPAAEEAEEEVSPVVDRMCAMFRTANGDVTHEPDGSDWT